MSKNGFVLKKNPMNCFKNWHAILIWHGIDAFTGHFFILFVWRPFFPFFHFFKVLKKVFIRLFSNWVVFTALVMKTILNRFIECGLVSLFNWDNFSWLFEKNCFFPFLTQHFHLKNKKFWKWLKMVFDGWFELPIFDLVGIEYLKVKMG